MQADKSKYEHLWNDLRINMAQSDDRYPHDISSTRNILYNYSMPNSNNNTNDTQIVLSQVNSDDSESWNYMNWYFLRPSLVLFSIVMSVFIPFIGALI